MEKSKVMQIISDETLTYSQQVLALARLAESEDSTLKRNPLWDKTIKEGKVCDLNEGYAPYRPRYILPDYDILMKKGCKFLELEPAKTLLEACNNLLIFYKHLPSITSYPVYLGNFTDLFMPWDDEVSNPQTKEILKLFLKHIDKTLCDSFVHANIGPKDSKITRLILNLTKEMQLAIPNITLLYDDDITPHDLAIASIDTMLYTSKPSFANHKMYSKEHKNNHYGIASCYNALNIGGGGYTLPRLRLYEISTEAKSLDDFMDNVLPKYVKLILENIDQRIKFIVEESSFFKSNFLVKEGFVQRERRFIMFCFQCEQTAGGKGCMGKAGVCGKRAETADHQDGLVGALIALAQAAEKNPSAVSETTHQLILDGLFTTVTNVSFNDDTIQVIIDRTRAEKAQLGGAEIPDYDMQKVWNGDEDIRSLKSLILFGIKGMAAYAYHAHVLGYTDAGMQQFFYKRVMRMLGVYTCKNKHKILSL